MKTFKDLAAIVRSYLTGAISLTDLSREFEALYFAGPDLVEDEAHPFLIGIWVRVNEVTRGAWTEDALKAHLKQNLENYEAWFAMQKPAAEG